MASPKRKSTNTKVGRPTLYRREYCEKVIELGRLGKSKAQIAATLDVARQTLEDWCIAHSEFLDALTRARDLAQAWWEDQGQAGIFVPANTGTFNSSLWAKQVSCRFPDDYRDVTRTEMTGKDGGAIKTEAALPDLSNLTDEELRTLDAIASKVAGVSGESGD